MNSRMDKYISEQEETSDRTTRNKNLYDRVFDSNIDYVDINYDNSVVINPSIKSAKTRSEYQNRKNLNSIIPQKREEKITNRQTVKEEKIYDINQILKLARENKLFDDEKKRLINTEYNILTKLDIDQINSNENLSKENLRDLIDNIYKNDETKKQVVVKEERDLLSDLIDDKVEKAITDGINKKIMEKTYEVTVQEERKALAKTIYDETVSSNENIASNASINPKTQNISREVADTFDMDDDKHESFLIIIIIIVIILLAAVGYLFYKYFSTM